MAARAQFIHEQRKTKYKQNSMTIKEEEGDEKSWE